MPLNMTAKQGFIILSIIINCNIHIGRCTNQNCPDKRDISFNGHELGFINYKNLFIIGIDIVKEYLDLFCCTGVSFVAWWKTRVLTISDPERPLLNTTHNWQSYAGLFHEIFCLSAEKFNFCDQNSICCENPETILMDGIVVSIKTSNLPEFTNPWVINTINKRLTIRKDRQFSVLKEPYISILETLLSNNGVAVTTYNILKTSSHSGVKCLGFCLQKRGQLFFLKTHAKMFAQFLTKKVASIKSIIPIACADVIKR